MLAHGIKLMQRGNVDMERYLIVEMDKKNIVVLYERGYLPKRWTYR